MTVNIPLLYRPDHTRCACGKASVANWTLPRTCPLCGRRIIAPEPPPAKP